MCVRRGKGLPAATTVGFKAEMGKATKPTSYCTLSHTVLLSRAQAHMQSPGSCLIKGLFNSNSSTSLAVVWESTCMLTFPIPKVTLSSLHKKWMSVSVCVYAWVCGG